MKRLDRRSFLRTAAGAGGGIVLMPMIEGGWAQLAGAEKAGYFEREFGIMDGLCRKVLNKALGKGGDFAEVYFEHTVSNSLGLEDKKVDRAYSAVNLGVGIRTVKGEQVGYGFTQELTEKSMMTAAETAATIADSSGKAEGGGFKRVEGGDYYPVSSVKPAPLAARLGLVEGVAGKCFARSNLVVKINAGFRDAQKRIMVITSDGYKAEDFRPNNALYASVVAEKEGRREQFWFSRGGRRDFSYYTEQIVEEISRKAVEGVLMLFEAVTPPAGEMPVVFASGDPGVLLHEAIGHGMEADFNRKKTSLYCTMMGQKVAEPIVTVVDDATIPAASGSVNFDDEGTPGQRTVLVENGVLKGYLCDKISARHYGVASTGNGRRESYEYYPIPRMRNTFIAGGPHKAGEIIESVKKGIYIENVSNGQVNVGQGDFAFYVSQGRLIEDGELGPPIKDVNIMGNGPKMLRDITMVADDLALGWGGMSACGKDGQMVPADCGMPTVLVKSLTVGGTGKEGA